MAGGQLVQVAMEAVACARGARGPALIRGGRRSVERSPLGALTFFFDPAAALASAAHLARAVLGATSLLDAHEILTRLGIRTELDYELAHGDNLPGG
jgi:hypothetical protein